MSTNYTTDKPVSPARPRSKWRIIIIASVIVVLVGLGFLAVGELQQMQRDQQTQVALKSAPLTGITTVEIVQMEFKQANIQVKVGTTITWINNDNVAHSVTFNNGMKDSGLINQGGSFKYTFTTTGTFSYYCSVHPNMVAQVIVIP